ncbi:MAG: hypothetical protein H0V82_04965 [Candidatus Protochlamydia sp.]|nr:hypothetical protein [Candidatus Protochlamydia sp.]
MSFSLDCSSMYVSASNQLASWYASVASFDIISRIREIALTSFSYMYQMCTRSETPANQINVKTGALLSCAVLVILFSVALIKTGRQNRPLVPGQIQ